MFLGTPPGTKIPTPLTPDYNLALFGKPVDWCKRQRRDLRGATVIFEVEAPLAAPPDHHPAVQRLGLKYTGAMVLTIRIFQVRSRGAALRRFSLLPTVACAIMDARKGE